MKERTKKLMSGYDSFKEYDEQKEIKKGYFKGCGYCRGEENPLIFRRKRLNPCHKLKIKGNKLLLFTKVYKDIFDDTSTHIDYYEGYAEINFCPFCGKQLIEKLDKYID